jgi:hypothetical protein
MAPRDAVDLIEWELHPSKGKNAKPNYIMREMGVVEYDGMKGDATPFMAEAQRRYKAGLIRKEDLNNVWIPQILSWEKTTAMRAQNAARIDELRKKFNTPQQKVTK